jgi:hypothetical protein
MGGKEALSRYPKPAIIQNVTHPGTPMPDGNFSMGKKKVTEPPV